MAGMMIEACVGMKGHAKRSKQLGMLSYHMEYSCARNFLRPIVAGLLCVGNRILLC
jgi:hypothetical protein